MLPDDLFTIKKYVAAHHKPADPIPDKSKDRVITSVARSIRTLQKSPITKGACQLCAHTDERLLPINIKICRGCFQTFLNKAGTFPVIKSEMIDYYCDWCFGRTFRIFLVNPDICRKCMFRLGEKHKKYLPAMKAQMRKPMLKRKFYI